MAASVASTGELLVHVPAGHQAEAGADPYGHVVRVGVDEVSYHRRNPRTRAAAPTVTRSASPRMPAPNWSASIRTSWTLGATVCVMVTVGAGVGVAVAVGAGAVAVAVESVVGVGDGAGKVSGNISACAKPTPGGSCAEAGDESEADEKNQDEKVSILHHWNRSKIAECVKMKPSLDSSDVLAG